MKREFHGNKFASREAASAAGHIGGARNWRRNRKQIIYRLKRIAAVDSLYAIIKGTTSTGASGTPPVVSYAARGLGSRRVESFPFPFEKHYDTSLTEKYLVNWGEEN